ncbi:MAG: diacylglycerol kinase family protein [Candidatus Korobacteraceae bacterium]
MPKTFLIYNPQSGRRRALRRQQVEIAAGILLRGGMEVTMSPTSGPGSAGEQARNAITQGHDTIIACGGDGTVHEVLQGIAGSRATLGLIPLGTGNALAYDLGIPRDPAAAAHALLRARICHIHLGETEYSQGTQTASPYFLTVCGAGADAEMLYKLAFQFKTRFGMFAYYAVGARLWLTHRFVPFRAEFTDLESGTRRSETVTQILAVRVTRFGELLRELAHGASLERQDFQLVLFKTSSRLRYLRQIAGMMSARHWPVRDIETVRTNDVLCTPLENSRRVYVEADGELLGKLPARLRMSREKLSLLKPL